MTTNTCMVSYSNRTLPIEYSYRKGGKGPLLYLHGLGCSKSDFAAALTRPALENFTLASFDFPGSGKSGYFPGLPLDLVGLVEITRQVVLTLSLDQPVIAGHSMGGVVGLLYILRYPSDVKAFINIEGNLISDDCFFSRRAAECDPREFERTVFPYFIQLLEQSSNRGFRTYAETLKHGAHPAAFQDYSCSLVEHSDRTDLLKRYIALSIPTLFVYGSENRDLPYLPALLQAGCLISEIPASNHFPGYDNPDAFYRAIAEFLHK